MLYFLFVSAISIKELYHVALPLLIFIDFFYSGRNPLLHDDLIEIEVLTCSRTVLEFLIRGVRRTARDS